GVTFEEQTYIKVMIKVVVPTLVKTRSHNFRLPKMTGLRSFVGPTQTVRGRLRDNRMNDARLVADAEHHCIAANPFGLWMTVEVIDGGIEGAGEINIVAVEETKDVACRTLKTFVDGVHLASILFADPVSKVLLVAFDYIDTFIRAAAVDDDVLQRFVSLIQYRLNRLFKKTSLIEGRSNYSELWRHDEATV